MTSGKRHRSSFIREPANFATGDEVDLTIYGKTPMDYKAIVDNTHTGLIFANEVSQELALGEKLKGWIAGVRADEGIDLYLHPPGRTRVDDLEK